MKKYFISVFVAISVFFLFPGNASADTVLCQNRFVTLVNPVRGRDLWSDKSLTPVINQSVSASKYNFPVTWLLQYDALTDGEVVDVVKTHKTDEVGLFLEVSKSLADKAGVVYQNDRNWSDPSVVFMSAYAQSERRRLIDALYSQYKATFGYYPNSVGAWWVDSYSLNYIKEKYGLSAILIVADQKTTDSYGVWGQWWGYPYYPSKYNVLVPANSSSLTAVVIQWAQRDPVRAYGEGPAYSNFSLQANDYIRNGQNTNYFKTLVSVYLGCDNPLGQITIGLETGMESSAFQNEYDNQVKYLSTLTTLKAVTMTDFASAFKELYSTNPEAVTVAGWKLTPGNRQNSALGDLITYDNKTAFSDYFIADKNSFLNRTLPLRTATANINSSFWFLLLTSVLFGLSVWKKNGIVFAVAFLLCLVAYGLIFRSGTFLSWQVFYGPYLKNIMLVQLALALFVFVVIWLVNVKLRQKVKDLNLLLWLLPLSYGIDMIVNAIRVSNINGGYFLGVLIGGTRLLGFIVSGLRLSFMNSIFPVRVAQSFLKIPVDKIWPNLALCIIFYPLTHILLAWLMYLLIRKLDRRLQNVLIMVLILLLLAQIVSVLASDPRFILPAIN